ncbi:MAG: vWFA domain containing protein [Candidatus Methanohalarchaeum thermophilum]|uniref:VWFA domain containing protein n=1 Tax=Methanohalarchaeum thermophilum TaxID=1903181 RepID=A0A1Q6DW19_METT1|nr:MAG: vWFA domain containing protein [Candidatus Methanohalarchaeum thermophilum]
MTIKANYESEKRFFQKIDRILLGKEDIKVSKDSADLRNDHIIYLPLEKKSNQFEEYEDYLIEIKALNYHNLAHIMFSDLKANEIAEKIQKKVEDIKRLSIKNFIKKIEDARVEQKFIEIYPLSRKYFKNKIYQEAQNNNVGFLDAYCRKFLEDDFRKKLIINSLNGDLDNKNLSKSVSRNLNTKVGIKTNDLELNFDGKKFDELKEHLDRFIFLDDSEERINEASASYELIPKLYPNIKPLYGNIQGFSFSTQFDKNVDIKDKVQKDELSKLHIDKLMKEKQTNSYQIEETSRKNEKETKKELDTEIQKEAKLIKKGGGWSPSPTDSNEKEISLDEFFDQKMITRKNQIKRILKKIKLNMREQWRRKERRGKIDLRSAMKAKREGKSKIFKKYYPNREKENSLAIVILLDKSGSMSGKLIRRALKSCWSIRKALEELDEKACTIAFDTEYEVIKDWFGEPSYEVGAGGGTNPEKALKVADKKIEEILQFNDKLNPVIITITDSEYDPKVERGTQKPSQRIRSLKKKYNSKIAEININEEEPEYQRMNIFDYYVQCPSIKKLPQALEEIIEEIEIKLLNKSTRLKRRINL